MAGPATVGSSDDSFQRVDKSLRVEDGLLKVGVGAGGAGHAPVVVFPNVGGGKQDGELLVVGSLSPGERMTFLPRPNRLK